MLVEVLHATIYLMIS